MKKRFVAAAVSFIFILVLLPVTVSANSPPPSFWYSVQLENLPEGTVYVDMLIPLETSDPFYSELEENNLPAAFSKSAEIAVYCEDGFRSYTLHYVGARSVMRVSKDNRVFFFTDGLNELGSVGYDHMQEIQDRGQMRLAMLDESGNILQVSSVLVLKSRNALASLSGVFAYDALTDEFEIGHDNHPLNGVFYFILAFSGLVLTCIVEYLVAIPFDLWKYYGRTIVLVNVASQIFMHLLFILLYGVLFWRYSFAVLALEILVYAGEFLYYRRKMFDVPLGKCIGFTVTANTASLICGVLCFAVLLFG